MHEHGVLFSCLSQWLSFLSSLPEPSRLQVLFPSSVFKNNRPSLLGGLKRRAFFLCSRKLSFPIPVIGRLFLGFFFFDLFFILWFQLAGSLIAHRSQPALWPCPLPAWMSVSSSVKWGKFSLCRWCEDKKPYL